MNPKTFRKPFKTKQQSIAHAERTSSSSSSVKAQRGFGNSTAASISTHSHVKAKRIASETESSGFVEPSSKKAKHSCEVENDARGTADVKDSVLFAENKESNTANILESSNTGCTAFIPYSLKQNKEDIDDKKDEEKGTETENEAAEDEIRCVVSDNDNEKEDDDDDDEDDYDDEEDDVDLNDIAPADSENNHPPAIAGETVRGSQPNCVKISVSKFQHLVRIVMAAASSLHRMKQRIFRCNAQEKINK
eukprot:ANDGO_06867.mRNA.1 hypothetical protein